MTDNRSDNEKMNDSVHRDMVGRDQSDPENNPVNKPNHNTTEKNEEEKNVTEMNTEDQSIEIKQLIDCSESILPMEEDEQLDALLDELLGEIAQRDAEVIAPLEAQAAWRKAIRAEAAAQEKAAAKKAKIIPINRWMRTAGSIAAALVVLFAGTYGARLGDMPPQTSDENHAALYEFYNNEQNTDSAERWNDPVNGVVISAGGYSAAALRSDGADDQNNQNDVSTEVKTPADTVTTQKQNDMLDDVEPVIIRSAQRSIQSTEYDRDVQWLSDLVSEYDAYYEEKSETAANALGGRVSNLTIRVPVERLDDFLMEMDQLGTTVMRSEKAEEITGRYMDTQSRLDALYQQKSKLSGMMDNALNLQEVIAVDAQLTEVIAEIERLEGDMRRWRSQQSYATVKVALSEVFEQPLTSEASLGERMKAGFDESVVWLGEFGQDALVVLAAVLPRLVVFIPAAVLLGVLIWAFARKKKN